MWDGDGGFARWYRYKRMFNNRVIIVTVGLVSERDNRSYVAGLRC
jgi:hypothetical protein